MRSDRPITQPISQTGVIPAKAGIQIVTRQLDSGLRRNDGITGIES